MVTRIGGLASGMDIDSIVGDMMKAQRAPLDKLMQKKQILEWQRDDYRSINTLLLNFRTNELTNMKLTTNYRAKSVSSSDESKVAATATSGASQASYNMSKVSQLATAEVWRNGGKITGDGKSIDLKKSLYSQGENFGEGSIAWKEGAVNAAKPIKVDAAGKEFTLESTDAANIKADGLDSWSVKVNGKAYQVITSGTPGENQVLVDSGGKLTFKNDIAANSEIRVDYIGKVKTEKISIAPNSTAALSQPGVTFPAGAEIKLFTTDRKTNQTTESSYSLSPEGRISDGNGKEIASINRETGVISFTEHAPKSNEDFSYQMEVNYSHRYTTFSMNSSTSTGAQYENFLVAGGDSLNTVISKVNDSKVGVSMFFDTGTNQMTLTRKEKGKFSTADADLAVNGDFLTDTLRFVKSEENVTKGQNAEFTINGLSTNRSSNTFTIDGVTFTLKQTFETAPGNSVSINASNNNEAIFDNIKNFINKYNEVIGTILDKTNETRNKSYQPLTDEEREGLSDKQQEKWEEVAKTGLLRRDSLLTGALSQMRADFYGTVNNSEISSAYDQLAKIGISTSSNYLDGGKLVIDEKKLKAAIDNDPASVEQLFRGESGIVHKLSETVTSTMDKLKSKAGNANSTNQTFVIGRELEDISKRQPRFEDRLEQLETRYWRQFKAMENAIQRSNQQSAYLSQFFSA